MRQAAYFRGLNCWMSAMATPLDSLSAKLAAPNTNAPQNCTYTRYCKTMNTKYCKNQIKD